MSELSTNLNIECEISAIIKPIASQSVTVRVSGLTGLNTWRWQVWSDVINEWWTQFYLINNATAIVFEIEEDKRYRVVIDSLGTDRSIIAEYDNSKK